MDTLTHIDLADFESRAGEAATLLRALGNEKRLMVLCRLKDGECSVGELLPHTGLSQSALSQHLAKLREEGVVATRRDGQAIFYRIADPSALQLILTLADIYCPKVQEA